MKLYILSGGLVDFVYNALGVNLADMIIQIASTIILVMIVKHFLWERVTDFLEARKDIMDKDIVDAKKMKEEAELLKKEANDEMVSVQGRAKEIMDNATVRAEENRERIEMKAKKEASKIIDNAHKEVELELEKARNEIKEEIVDVAMVIAEQIVEREIDESKHKKIVDEVIKEVSS